MGACTKVCVGWEKKFILMNFSVTPHIVNGHYDRLLLFFFSFTWGVKKPQNLSGWFVSFKLILFLKIYCYMQFNNDKIEISSKK